MEEAFLYPNRARFPVKFDAVDDIVPHVASLFLDASNSLNMEGEGGEVEIQKKSQEELDPNLPRMTCGESIGWGRLR